MSQREIILSALWQVISPETDEGSASCAYRAVE